jgi:lysyl-tRNA synthetase class 1
MKGFEMLVEALKKIPSTAQAEDIQTEIYNIGMSLEFENLRDWFSGFYEVILGQKQGPRLGSFIKFFGINKTIELLESKIREN